MDDDDDRIPRTYHRRYTDTISVREHEDLEDRVDKVEGKLDRITWMVVATLVTALLDLWKATGH